MQTSKHTHRHNASHLKCFGVLSHPRASARCQVSPCGARGIRAPSGHGRATLQRSPRIRAIVAPTEDVATTDSKEIVSALQPSQPAIHVEEEAEPARVPTWSSPMPMGCLSRNPVFLAWQAYCKALENHPMTTKCFTSLTGFLLGDIIAQGVVSGTHFDVARCAILASYGFLIDAPAGNAFYHWLDANICPEKPKSAEAVGTKIAIDQLLYAPVFTCVLYMYLSLLHGNFSDISDILQEKVPATLIANYAIWPLAHGLNFFFVPTEQRILYNNFVGVCWTTWLSYIAH